MNFILYTTRVCPYCEKVKKVIKDEDIKNIEIRDASNPTFREELIEKGGKTQVPFLWDIKKEEGIHESDDIIKYLRANK
ncbi:MAG: glutathione S-transferase N-terminal domain-containing protein [Alphaproteobacteria bacterium]|nr:glutathione S-transferase N-terminal domain-containing protein [Alphaproteobacteria bacterium]